MYKYHGGALELPAGILYNYTSTSRADLTNAIDGFAVDSQGFTKSSRGYTRIYGGFADGFTTGSRTGSRKIRESSREFARVRESSREFARVRVSSREFARVREGCADGVTTDIRRIRGLTQIHERIHSGFTRVLCSQFTAVNPSMAFDKSALRVAVKATAMQPRTRRSQVGSGPASTAPGTGSNDVGALCSRSIPNVM